VFSRFATTAVIYDKHTGEYSNGSNHLLPAERVHPQVDTKENRNNRLDIRVHADQCRAYALLPEWYQEVGDKGGKQNQEAQIKKDG